MVSNVLFFPHRRFKIGLKCDESKFPGEVASVFDELVDSVSAYVCIAYKILSLTPPPPPPHFPGGHPLGSINLKQQLVTSQRTQAQLTL